ncbi:MAG: hypothetical protein JST16_12465 [Bdellovibrionales bacterium]|nr:hypothetical protein [Bdellovibrionales bacterium]
MKNSLRLLAVLSLSLGLQACEVDVENGRVPADYIPTARVYEGTYTGDMDGRRGTIVMTLKEDGYAEVATPGFEGGDIYDVGCGSVIGPLLRISGKQAKDGSVPVLERLVWGYHHSAFECISQNEINFDFGTAKNGQPDINVSMTLFYASSGAAYKMYGYFIKK